MNARRRSSGLEQIPAVFGRPLWKDAFFWATIATACFWALALGWLFF